MGRRLRTTLIVVAAGLLAALLVCGYVLVDSQSSARRDIQDRFRERATSSAALTESLFASASGTAQRQNARRYGGAAISSDVLARDAGQANNLYLAVLSEEGKILGASPGTPANMRSQLETRPPYVRDVLAGRPYSLSDIQQVGAGRPSLTYAQGFPTRFGTRALITGIDAKLIYQFLGGSLAQLPTVAGGNAYVLDSRGAIVASPGSPARAGRTVTETGLVAALNQRGRGSFANDRYFVADAVAGTTWRVVLTAPNDKLFASVSGTHKWVPWILLVGFGLAAMVALMLVGRMLQSAAEVRLANERVEERATELASSNEQLAQANDELGRVNEELERFASIASHDLQEPLRKVRMFAGRVTSEEGPQLTDKGREYLERMNEAATRMQALIDGLLLFSRIKTPARPSERIALTPIAHEVVEDLGVVIDEIGASVQVGTLPTLPADPLQMRQLLQNLISNGLKFRREDVAPVVRVDGSVGDETAQITVTDNGIGFDARFAQRIFRVFERLHPQSDYPGTGIGLALCRRIVERHGGTISAESTPGEGSTFTVTLPLHPADRGPAPQSDREDAALVRG
jgi:signal transduction histidine kinase